MVWINLGKKKKSGNVKALYPIKASKFTIASNNSMLVMFLESNLDEFSNEFEYE